MAALVACSTLDGSGRASVFSTVAVGGGGGGGGCKAAFGVSWLWYTVASLNGSGPDGRL